MASTNTFTISAPPVIAADQSQADQMIATLVLALAADPLMRWMCPDPLQYSVHWAAMAKAYGSRAFEHGSADCTPGFSGAALWLPPGVQPDEDSLAPLFLEHIEAGKQEHLFNILEGMSANHPAEPHWHLALIGVDPAHQNRGIGSTLLHHALARCDRDRTLAYVESSNVRNLPFYERHGFVVAGEILVDGAPTVWPMVRGPGQLVV